MPLCHRTRSASASRLDRAAFLKPIAHRGLHAAERGIIENTGPAFEAALSGGFGIECDLRPAAGGLPLVFHDDTLDRLIEGSGPVAGLTRSDVARLRYRGSETRITTFAELLEMVAGRQPLLVEVKNEWEPPVAGFIEQIADLVRAYRGPLALMSFDPDVMAALAALAPDAPRGIVSGLYRREPDDDWWSDKLSRERAQALGALADLDRIGADFVAYHVKALPAEPVSAARERGLPIFTWTVRSGEEVGVAAQWADAPIFEGEAARAHYTAGRSA